MKIILATLAFLLLTAFTPPILSPATLMVSADKYDEQEVTVMGVVETIHKVIGPWSFGYYYEIGLYLRGDKTLIVIAMTPQIPLRLKSGDLVRVKGKFHRQGKFATYIYENFIEATKIFSLEAA
jgi:hypothetical protein